MTADVYQFDSRLKVIEEKAKHGSGEPPYDDGMEARVARLETIIKTLATKEDVLRLEVTMHKEINSQTWKFVTWMTGICTALIAATYFIATHVSK